MSITHTAVVVRKVARNRERDYEEWLAKVVSALHNAPGYEGMTAITSHDTQGSIKAMLIRFQSGSALSDWERSTKRRNLIDDANRFSTAQYQTAPGVESFFAIAGSMANPPRWKMCVLTIPTVYLLLSALLFVVSHLIPNIKNWPTELRLVPVTSIMTVLLTYICLPAVSKAFAPWLFSPTTPILIRTFEPSNF